EVTEDGEVIDAPSLPAADDPRISEANALALIQRCEEHDLDVAEVVRRGTHDRTEDPREVHKTEVPAVKQAIDFLTEAEAAVDAERTEGLDAEVVDAEVIEGGEPF